MTKDEFSSSGGGSGRKMLLVVLLLLVAAAFGYDFLVAKPAFDNAVKSLNEMTQLEKDSDGNVIKIQGVAGDEILKKIGDKNNDGRITAADVAALLNKQPASETKPEEFENNMYETYSYMRGIPFQTYDLHVVYSQAEDGEFVFYKAKGGAIPTKNDFRKKTEFADPSTIPEIGRAGAGPPPSGGQDDNGDKEKSRPETEDEGADSSGDAKKDDG